MRAEIQREGTDERMAKDRAKDFSVGAENRSLGIVLGAKAVDSGSIDSNSLQYWNVNERTLAVCYVWSHGQGSRPAASLCDNSY